LIYKGYLQANLYDLTYENILLKLFKVNQEKSRWQIADGPWDLELHDFKQLLQISWQQGWDNTAFSANRDTTNT
jgi:hypothetical protein